jgi:hypothetical protein
MQMFRFSILMVLLSFAVSAPAYSQNFEVKEVREHSKQVVLRDRDTGEEWVAEVGDEIGGWRVVQITQHHISMAKSRDDQPMLMTKIPVKQGGRSINVNVNQEGQ